MSEYGIADVCVLVHQPNHKMAQRLLERIANAVLPIVIKYKFRVRRLQEFLPHHPQLLGKNVNRGRIIYLRLRHSVQHNVFLRYEAVLETMIHELAHMIHGPHDKHFYKLFDQMKDEMETLMLGQLVDPPHMIPIDIIVIEEECIDLT